jgi:hypothetical protein
LSTKLEEELSYELEDVASKEVPEFLAKFKKAGVWTVRADATLVLCLPNELKLLLD